MHLKDSLGFDVDQQINLVNTNRRCSSFKYMEAVNGVPSAIVETGTGEASPIGTSTSITTAVDWYTNEMLRHDLKEPIQIEKALEKSILTNRSDGYSNSVLSNILDDGLQVLIEHKDFNGANNMD